MDLYDLITQKHRQGYKLSSNLAWNINNDDKTEQKKGVVGYHGIHKEGIDEDDNEFCTL